MSMHNARAQFCKICRRAAANSSLSWAGIEDITIENLLLLFNIQLTASFVSTTLISWRPAI
jgi:hypothetical protein